MATTVLNQTKTDTVKNTTRTSKLVYKVQSNKNLTVVQVDTNKNVTLNNRTASISIPHEEKNSTQESVNVKEIPSNKPKHNDTKIKETPIEVVTVHVKAA